MFLLLERVFVSNRQGKKTKVLALRVKFKASADHFWPAGHMLCMPALALGKIRLNKVNWQLRNAIFIARFLQFCNNEALNLSNHDLGYYLLVEIRVNFDVHFFRLTIS